MRAARLALGTILVVAGATTARAQFVGLGFVPGHSSSRAVAVAREGTSVVGITPGTTGYSWMWRRDSGLQALPLPADAKAARICDDGGTVLATTGSFESTTVTWLREGLSPVVLPNTHTQQVGLSGDGEVVFVSTPSYQFGQLQRWTLAGGFENLPSGPNLEGPSDHGYWGGFNPGQIGGADFQGIQAIGLGWNRYCIRSSVGECNGLFYDYVVFSWSADSGTAVMPSSAGYVRGPVLDASTDLRYKLVGNQSTGSVSIILDDGVPTELPLLSTTGGGRAVISGDGEVAAAGGFVWDRVHSTRPIAGVLSGAGLRFDGWSGLVVTGLDARGRRLCGYGTNPAGASEAWFADLACGSADFNGDGDVGTDADIEAFFACIAGSCCGACGSADFDGDGDVGTDADIESFFRVLGGGAC